MTEPERTLRNKEASSPQEEVATTTEVQFISVKRAEQFMEIYANYVSLATSPWDITLMFGRTIADDPRNPYIEQRLSATLSPQAAKALAEILWRNIQAYEEQYGEIRYTPLQPSQSEQSENPPRPSPPHQPTTRRAMRLDDQDD
ncbi:MAG: DUF3467 domain-containing protein [Candidatus Entotheonellia bacterium]